MERKYYNDNFERYLKEQTDDFRMIPSKRVWHSLYNGMHPSRRWPSFLMFFILTTGVLYIGKENTSIPNNTNYNDEPTSYAKVKSNKKSFKKSKQNNNAFSESFNDDYLYSNDWVMNDYDITPNSTTSIKITEPFGNGSSNNTPVDKTQKAKETDLGKTTILVDDNTFEDNADSKSNILTDVAKNDKKEEKQKTDKNKIAITDSKNKNEVASFKGKKGKKDGTTIEFYATPSVGFRKLNTENAFNTNSFANSNTSSSQSNTDKSFMNHKPALNLEAGFNFAFAASKKINLKAGLQLNLTNYNISGKYLNHTVPTSLAEINPVTGAIDYTTVPAYVTNDKNANQVVHNTTYQISVPVGAYYKVLAKNKFDLFVGASVQPTFVFGGNPNVISADKLYYVSDPSLLRRWNMNTAAEAYISYKFGNLNLLAGPQVRYQLFSTYKNNISVSERLYNLGFKIGISKSF